MFEIVIATKNSPRALSKDDLRGRYSLYFKARYNHTAKIISTTILQKKALGVINGKKNELDTKNGINGTAKIPDNTTRRREFFSIIPPMVAKRPYFYYNLYVITLRNRLYSLLRRSEGVTKTDMVYLAKGGFWLLLTQGIAAIATFILSIAFANLLPKEDYGVYKYLLSIGTLIASFSLTGLGTALIQSISKGFEGALKQATRISLKWNSIPIIISLSGSIYYFYKGNITLSSGLLLLSLLNPLINTFTLYNSYLVGKKDFKSLGVAGSYSSIFQAICIFVAIFFTQNILWILFAYLGGSLISTTLNYLRVIFIYHPDGSTDSGMTSYAKHLSLMDILYSIADQIDRVVIFKFFGGAELAIYAFAVAIPTQFGGMLRNIKILAFSKLAKQDGKEIRSSLNDKVLRVLIISSVVTIAYIIAAPTIFKIFFPQYMEAVRLSQIYALSIIPSTTAILPTTFLEAHKVKRALYIQRTISPISRIILFSWLGYVYGALGMVIAMVASKTITLISLQILSRKALD